MKKGDQVLEAKRAIVRAIPKEVSEEALKLDLEHYREKALEWGASGAEIIPAQYIRIDERVRLKCFVPRCPRAGETPHCPPDTLEPEQARKALSRYAWAILFKVDVAPVAEFIPKPGQPAAQRRKVLSYHGKTNEIVCEVENLAFKEGYYLAAGFAGGSCKDYLCNGLVCQFLDSGRCRFPYKARPSMEAIGIDVFGLVKKVGWDVYPIAYEEAAPDSIPCAISVGIVFIH